MRYRVDNPLWPSSFCGIEKSFSIVTIAPWRSPHAIKLQLAPCQVPVANQTTAKLNTNRPFDLTREPPSGK